MMDPPFCADFLQRMLRGPEAIGPGALEEAAGLNCASAFASNTA